MQLTGVFTRPTGVASACSRRAPASFSGGALGKSAPVVLFKKASAPVRPVLVKGAAANADASPSSFSDASSAASIRLGDAARKALVRATKAVERYGWISFWIQLTVSVVSGVILLFSVAFTAQTGPKASLYLTLLGIILGFLSTFWNFGYTRTAMKMQSFLDAPPGVEAPKVKKQQVLDMISKGMLVNLVGLGITLMGVQTLVGLLVAKTLTNASVTSIAAAASGNYNPVLALDVFLVQAATNTLLGHFLSLCCSLWLLHIVGEGKGLKFSVAAA